MKIWSQLYRNYYHYPLLTSLWITTTSTRLFSSSTYNNNYSIRYSNIFRTTTTSVVSAFTVTTTSLPVSIQSQQQQQQQQLQLNHFVPSSSTSLLQSRSISSFNHISDSIKGTNIGTTTALLLLSKINNQRNILRNHNNIRMFSTTSSNSNDMNQDTIDDTDTTTETNQSSSSSSLLHVAICQFHVTEDKEVNIQTCSNYIDRAIQQDQQYDQDTKSKVDLVVLPEIWNSPYATAAFAEYAEPIPNVEYENDSSTSSTSPTNISEIDSPSIYMLQQKAIQYNIYIVGGSIPEYDTTTQKLYNTCVVFNPIGQMIAKHQKVHLFDINVPNGITFKESDTLSSGTQITSFTINNNNKSSLDHTCTIGIGICYDIRFVEYALLLGQYCNILIYPGAFNLITGPAHWELLQRARAIDTQCYVITASPARYIIPPNNNDNNTDKDTIKPLKYPIYMAWGHSTIVSPWGDIIATTDEKESIVYGTIDLSNVTTIRQSIPIRNQKRNDIYQLTKK